MVAAQDQTTQKNFWDGTEGRRKPDHPVVVAFAEPKVNFIRACIRKEQSSDRVGRILDVGCGNGFFTMHLARWGECTAVDFSQRMLDLNPVSVTKICADVRSMPFAEKEFDLVFCSNLLHHVPDVLAVVLEMKRVSSRYVVISEPNRNNPLMFAFGLVKTVERQTLKFSQCYLKKLAAQAGLKVVDIASMGSIVPNKTPVKLLPLLKMFDGKFPLAFYNVMVCRID